MKALYVVLASVLLVLAGCTIESPGKLDAFAKCLTDNGIKMYGAYWCPHCLNQKKMFGSSFQYINYVECSLPNKAGQTEICNKVGIQSYPTWGFKDGRRVEGELTLADLSENSGCSADLVQ